MKISIGSDHHGVSIRLKLGEMIRQLGHEVIDHGPSATDTQPVDYPDVAVQVAREVSNKEVDRGVLICGTGFGMCIVANKFTGVRAAPISDEFSAELSRRHNDLNVLCLSGDMLTEQMIDRLVEIWIATPFEGGRHLRRIDKITEIEKQVRQEKR
ncbi:MAG: ribose 5-phosphate isomerase B [Thermoguttaceae bacterium]